MRGGKKRTDTDGDGGDVSVARGWRNARTDGRRRASEAEEGRESPECKAMFGRNVQPPVHSCNWTGSSPESCLPRRGEAEEVVVVRG